MFGKARRRISQRNAALLPSGPDRAHISTSIPFTDCPLTQPGDHCSRISPCARNGFAERAKRCLPERTIANGC